MDINELREKIRIKKDPHYPQTRVICLENTHNRCGGTILPLNFLEQVYESCVSMNYKSKKKNVLLQ